MSAYLAQVGTALYRVLPTGAAAPITLPAGITLYGPTQPCRAALFTDAFGNPAIIIVNGANRDFWIDQYGVARILTIPSPTAAPILTVGAGTGLTGTYAVAVTYKIKDASGITIWESAPSPISAGIALSNTSIKMANIPVQSAVYGVNARGIYRTLAGGNTLYPWFDIDDNLTTVRDRPAATAEASDAMLSLLPAPALRFGSPPLLQLIVAWKDRLWGVARGRLDFVRWSEDRLLYAWPADNELTVQSQQAKSTGITAFIPRRDQLGVAREEQFFQITGDTNDSFQRTRISPKVGCVSQESVVIVNDEAYLLGPFGTVQWGAEGIGYISDAQAYRWFNSDTDFNRALFLIAQAGFNPLTSCYELVLASAGSSALDRWVAFDTVYRRWLGPHRTDAFALGCVATDGGRGGILHAANGVQVSAFGSTDGYLYLRDGTQVDDVAATAVAIAARADLPFLSPDPEVEWIWGAPTITTRAEVGGYLDVYPTLGETDAPEMARLRHDLRLAKETLDWLGHGAFCRLSVRHAKAGETFRLERIRIPYTSLGRRPR